MLYLQVYHCPLTNTLTLTRPLLTVVVFVCYCIVLVLPIVLALVVTVLIFVSTIVIVLILVSTPIVELRVDCIALHSLLNNCIVVLLSPVGGKACVLYLPTYSECEYTIKTYLQKKYKL